MGRPEDTQPVATLFRLNGPELDAFARDLGGSIDPTLPEITARALAGRELDAWLSEHTSRKNESFTAEAFAGLSAIAAAFSFALVIMLPHQVRNVATVALLVFGIVWLISQTVFFVRRAQFPRRRQRALDAATRTAMTARPRVTGADSGEQHLTNPQPSGPTGDQLREARPSAVGTETTTPSVAFDVDDSIANIRRLRSSNATAASGKATGFDVDESIANIRRLREPIEHRRAEEAGSKQIPHTGPFGATVIRATLRVAIQDAAKAIESAIGPALGRMRALVEDPTGTDQMPRANIRETWKAAEDRELAELKALWTGFLPEELDDAERLHVTNEWRAAFRTFLEASREALDDAEKTRVERAQRAQREEAQSRQATLTTALPEAHRAMEPAIESAIDRMRLLVVDPTATDETPASRVRESWKAAEARELTALKALWSSFLPDNLDESGRSRANEEWSWVERHFRDVSGEALYDAEEADREVRWMNRPNPAPEPQPYGVSHEGAEHLVAAWMRHLGVRDAHVTSYSQDGGIDVESVEYVAQVKNYVGAVSVKEIRELHGVATADGKRALMFTSGTVTQEGRIFAKRVGIALIGYDAQRGTLRGLNGLGSRVIDRSIPLAFTSGGEEDCDDVL